MPKSKTTATTMHTKPYKKRVQFFSAHNITTIALLSAFSILLYKFLKFSLPIFPSFLEIHFSYIPVFLAVFMMGLPGGLSVVIVRFLLSLFWTSTSYVGEWTDLILGVTLIIPVWLIYFRRKSFVSALIGILVGVLVVTAMAIFINRIMIIPAYVKVFFGGSWDGLLGMVRGIFPNITQEGFYGVYLWAAVLPFNLLLFATSGIATLCLYRPLERILKQAQMRQQDRYRLGSYCSINENDNQGDTTTNSDDNQNK